MEARQPVAMLKRAARHCRLIPDEHARFPRSVSG
jgi:hypothetical protein